jgi:adenylate cyclase, class 1
MEILKIIEANREKFDRYNEIKFQRFQQLITSAPMRQVLNVIPFLLCVNEKRLPGYVDGPVPLGICRYVPDDETKRYLRGKFPAVKLEINTENPFVEMLAVMGSVGTVAYNKKSDFDYWVCVNRHRTGNEQYRCFEEKVQAVQKWAMKEVDVPVHLFINDVESIKQNIFAEDEEEAFGTTVGAVLKDEFLRSSTLVAGKIPFWWVVPHFVRDAEYADFFEKLPEELKAEYIDLGNLYEISREDFLGAALFQIIKSLGNPFKSLLKIGVLEKYIFGQEETPLLSQRIKINMQRGNLDNSIVDSYLLMFDEVFEYYSGSLGDKDLVDILKQNLYLKVNPQLSRYAAVRDKKNIPYKVAVMFRYIKAWGWDIATIRDLDNFDDWDFNKVMVFWDRVRRFMLMSYQKIAAQLPTLRLDRKISEKDFMLLSRKIKTHFSREKDKIDHFITFKDTPSEVILYLEPMSQGIHDVDWRLYKRKKSEQDSFTSTTLRVEKNLLPLLVWMSVNGIYDHATTRLNIQSGYTRINQTLITDLLGQIAALFYSEKLKIKNAYFLSPAFTLANMIIINFNREGLENVQSIQHLYHTSWGESYLKEYESDEDLVRVLLAVLKDGLEMQRNFDDYCVVSTPEPYKKVYKRITTIFKDAYTFLVREKTKTDVRFVTQFADKTAVFTRTGSGISATLHPSISKFLTAVTLKPLPSASYRFYAEETPLESVEAAYRQQNKNAISIVYEEVGEIVIIYVINEKGNLFTYIKPKAVKDPALMALHEFSRNAIKRLRQYDDYSQLDESTLHIWSLRRDRIGRMSMSDDTKEVENMYLARFKASSALSATIARHSAGEFMYNFTFPDGTSSGYLPIKDLPVIGSRIKELKSRGQTTYALVRDIHFSDITEEECGDGTSQFYHEKYKLEYVIDR